VNRDDPKVAAAGWQWLDDYNGYENEGMVLLKIRK
jgi:hypothetical protein